MPDAKDNGVDTDEILLESEDRMTKSVEALKKDLNNIRSGRAAPSMVESISIDYYGAQTPLNQLASVTVPEARMLVISPYEKKILGDIEKAILKSDLNITPQNDGVVIRLVLPDLSMERRQELVKQLKGRVEEARVAVRNIRRDANDAIKKLAAKHLSEDDIKAAQEETQELTNKLMALIDDVAAKKEKDIMTV